VGDGSGYARGHRARDAQAGAQICRLPAPSDSAIPHHDTAEGRRTRIDIDAVAEPCNVALKQTARDGECPCSLIDTCALLVGGVRAERDIGERR